MNEICGDSRFEIIAKAKADLLESTNIETDEAEMAVIDNILFRCWQMGWLDRYDTADTPQTEVEDGEDYLRGYNDGYYARGVLDKAGVEIHIDKPRGFTLKSISDTPQTKNVVGNKATLTIKDGVVKVTPQTDRPQK